MHNKVVHTHGHEVDAHCVMFAGINGDLQFGAHAVVGSNEDRVLKACRAQVKKTAKTAEGSISAGAAGGCRKWLDVFDKCFASVNVHASLFISVGLSILCHDETCPAAIKANLTASLRALAIACSVAIRGRYRGAAPVMKDFMHNYFKNSTVFHHAFALILGIMLCVAHAPQNARAAEDVTDRLFTIRDIKVDETSSTASRARETALEKAELQAYQTLLRKLVQEEGRAKLPVLNRNQIQSLITAIEVVDEQSSSRRYLATLNVRFEPGLVSQFLADNNVPHVLSTGQGILVLHGHRRGLTEILWEQDPVIMTARDKVDWVNRIRQYVFARGEISERAAITFREVQSLQAKQAREVAKIYGVRDALMIASDWYRTPYGPVLAYRYLSTDGNMEGEGRIEEVDNEAEAVAAMYEAVLDAIDTAWRGQLLVDTGVEGHLEMLVPTTNLAVLTEVQRKLEEVSLIRAVHTIEIGLPFSRIAFDYTGREEQLQLALRYAGLTLGFYGDERLLAPKSDDE